MQLLPDSPFACGRALAAFSLAVLTATAGAVNTSAAPLERARPTVTATVSTSTSGLAFAAASDPTLAALTREALERRPELARFEAVIRAERERVVRARALPDPTISLGIQNDGFTSIEIGHMETSFISIMASQTFLWPGKRDLRSELARYGVDAAEIERSRARLTTEADVRRAYVALLLARDRLALLDELEVLWTQSEQTAKARYEAGEAAQSDLLRAQLERARLAKRRWALEVEERAAIQALNRLRAKPIDQPIVTTTGLDALPEPNREDVARDALLSIEASPEVRSARLAIVRAEKGVALAEKDLFPDIGVSIGVMPRGELPPMWQANVSMTLPIFAGSKQNRAIAEARALREADELDATAVDLVLRQRVEARAVALSASLDTIALFRRGLLVQARATAESTLAQYRVGRVTFASVLEAVSGYIADKDELLRTMAEAQRIAIARAEISLSPNEGGGSGALSSGSMPGASSMTTTARGSSAATASPATTESAGSAMGGM